jgi:gamma-glutamyl:cysteine ligase YbdK (ATP-grasp superfamily)
MLSVVRNRLKFLVAVVAFFFRFRFREELAGYVGVELEFFLVGQDGVPAPEAFEFLRSMGSSAWTYELSACQVEVRTVPYDNDQDLFHALIHRISEGKKLAEQMGLELVAREAWSGQIPHAHYPSERYREVVAKMSEDRLDACYRVTAVHVHLGVSGWTEALLVHNRIVERLDRLLKIGDRSEGMRIKLFDRIYSDLKPPAFRSRFAVWSYAIRKGWAIDLGGHYAWVRISRHGTVEVRVFGASDDPGEIVLWVRAVRAAAVGDDHALECVCQEIEQHRQPAA